MARRKLFCDMYAALLKRITDALNHMTAWCVESKYGYGAFSFDVREYNPFFYDGIDEVAYVDSTWKLIDQDGNLCSLTCMDMEDLCGAIDWIEKTYSPDHKCGHSNI